VCEEDQTVLEAAQKAELGVGGLPICGNDDRLKGMVTDRDIVVKVLGAGKDAGSTRAGDLAQGEARNLPDPQVGDLLEALSTS
jgi:CBS domain-containing protein